VEIKGFLPDDDTTTSAPKIIPTPRENPIKAFIGDDDSVFKTDQLTTSLQNVDLMKEQNLDEFTYQDFKSHAGLREAAVRFAVNHLNFDPSQIDEEEAIDEAIEHFRSLDTNELTAITDYGYVSGLQTDENIVELTDYKNLYQAYRALPYFGSGSAAFNSFGSFATAAGDYAVAIGTAPSTLLGLAIPGGGKVAGQAVAATNKLLISNVLSNLAKKPISTSVQALASAPARAATFAAANPIKSAVALEASGALFQNIAQQNVEDTIEVREGISATEAALSTAIGATGAFVPVGLKIGFHKFIDKGTPELIKEATENAGKLAREADNAASKTINKNKEEVKKFRSRLNALDPDRVARGQKIGSQIAAEAGTLQPDFGIKFSREKADRILAFGVELLQKSGGLKDRERISDGIARTIETLREKGLDSSALSKEINDIKQKYNLTDSDVAALFAADISDAGRTLGKAGFQAKVFRNVMDMANDNIFTVDKTVKESFKRINETVKKEDGRGFIYGVSKLEGSDVDLIPRNKIEGAYEGLKKLARESDALRLALMVSQTATTVRNVVSGNVRVGMDVLTKAIDNGTRLATSKVYRDTVGAKGALEDVFAITYGLANKKEAVLAEEFLYNGFQDKATKMFSALRDMDPATGQPPTEMTTLRKFSRQINGLNTLSDNMFKRAAFIGELKRALNDMKVQAVKGGKVIDDADYDLREIMRSGKFNEVFGTTEEGKKFLDEAVEKALYFTYQRDANNPVSKFFIDGVHRFPFLVSSFVPFPRFIANALRFTYEYSPFYALEGGVKSFGKEARNYEEFSKSMVGMAFYLAATAYRYQYGEGTRWYEMKFPDGTKFDARPFFPAAPFLFAGDIAARWLTNDDRRQEFLTQGFGFDKQKPRVILSGGDLTAAIQALSGTQFRAGMGLWALESAMLDALKGDTNKILEFGKEFAGNIVTTYGIPLTASQDIYNSLMAPDEARIARETGTDNLNLFMLRKILARVPGNYEIEDMLQEQFGFEGARQYESPTKEAPVRRVSPITRQMFGILRVEKDTELQKELNDLKITSGLLYRRTRVPEADNYIRKFMGPYLEQHLGNYIRSPLYKSIKNADYRRQELLKIIDDFKTSIYAQAKSYANSVKGPEGSAFSKKEYKELQDYAKDFAMSEYEALKQKDPRLQSLEERGLIDYDLLYAMGKAGENMGPAGISMYFQNKE
jgi:hypothetical protein